MNMDDILFGNTGDKLDEIAAKNLEELCDEVKTEKSMGFFLWVVRKELEDHKQVTKQNSFDGFFRRGARRKWGEPVDLFRQRRSED